MKKIIMAIACGVLAAGIGFATVGCGGGTSINVYNRESGSGTRSAFIELLGITEEELIYGAAQHSSTGAVVTAVAGDPYGIGYISLGSVDNTVKALSVDGVAPSEETVLDGSYKISRPFVLMYQNTNNSDLLAGFLSYLESSAVQEVIADEGYVSIVENPAEYVAPTENFTDTSITVSGSTSVQPLMAILATNYQTLIRDELGQEITISVQGGGSSAGVSNAGNGTSDIGMASREVEASEFSNGSVMVIDTLCSDGIAVVVHPSNTVSNITLDQLKNIYTGATSVWNDVDGWVDPNAEEE